MRPGWSYPRYLLAGHVTFRKGAIMRTKLTPAFVQKARAEPGAECMLFWDMNMPGFGLAVTAAGHRSFVVQYRAGGRSRRRRKPVASAPFARVAGAPAPPRVSEEEALRASGPDDYYATRLRGASNEKAGRELDFRPRPLEWILRSKIGLISALRAYRIKKRA